MKLLALLIISISTLFGTFYYSKVEPYEIRKISSNVMGLVTKIDENKIGKILGTQNYLEIDAILDKKELKFLDEKLDYLRDTVIVNTKVLENLKELVSKKEDNYKKVKQLKIKSTIEKDKEFYDLVSSENMYLSTQKEINTLKTQITDLKLRRAQLLRNIADKELSAKGFMLYSIDVKIGQVVTKGTPLATVVDTHSAILTIYLNEEDLQKAKKSVVYINAEKTSYKIDRVLNIADSKNISKYKAQIIVKAPKIFSKLVKVELKDK